MSFCVAGVLDLQLSPCSLGFVYIAVSVVVLVSPMNLFFRPGAPALPIHVIPSTRYMWTLRMEPAGDWDLWSIVKRYRTGLAPQQIMLGVRIAQLSLQSTSCFSPSANTQLLFRGQHSPRERLFTVPHLHNSVVNPKVNEL